jgi:hypothetical protein
MKTILEMLSLICFWGVQVMDRVSSWTLRLQLSQGMRI